MSALFNLLLKFNLVAAHRADFEPYNEYRNTNNNYTYKNLEPELLPDVRLFDDDDWLRRLTLNFISVFRHNSKLVGTRLKVSIRNVSEV